MKKTREEDDEINAGVIACGDFNVSVKADKNNEAVKVINHDLGEYGKNEAFFKEWMNPYLNRHEANGKKKNKTADAEPQGSWSRGAGVRNDKERWGKRGGGSPQALSGVVYDWSLYKSKQNTSVQFSSQDQSDTQILLPKSEKYRSGISDHLPLMSEIAIKVLEEK